jgi:hypothetical protein
MAWFAVLNSASACAELLARARNQGNGLSKLQLFEYRRARVPNIDLLPARALSRLNELGRMLAESGDESVLQRIDSLLEVEYAEDAFASAKLREVLPCARQPTVRR